MVTVVCSNVVQGFLVEGKVFGSLLKIQRPANIAG